MKTLITLLLFPVRVIVKLALLLISAVLAVVSALSRFAVNNAATVILSVLGSGVLFIVALFSLLSFAGIVDGFTRVLSGLHTTPGSSIPQAVRGTL